MASYASYPCKVAHLINNSSKKTEVSWGGRAQGSRGLRVQGGEGTMAGTGMGWLRFLGTAGAFCHADGVASKAVAASCSPSRPRRLELQCDKQPQSHAVLRLLAAPQSRVQDSQKGRDGREREVDRVS